MYRRNLREYLQIELQDIAIKADAANAVCVSTPNQRSRGTARAHTSRTV
jgi:hypothetical protein